MRDIVLTLFWMLLSQVFHYTEKKNIIKMRNNENKFLIKKTILLTLLIFQLDQLQQSHRALLQDLKTHFNIPTKELLSFLDATKKQKE